MTDKQNKELQDIRLMAQAIVEMVDKLIVDVPKKKTVNKLNAEYERYRVKRLKVMFKK